MPRPLFHMCWGIINSSCDHEIYEGQGEILWPHYQGTNQFVQQVQIWIDGLFWKSSDQHKTSVSNSLLPASQVQRIITNRTGNKAMCKVAWVRYNPILFQKYRIQRYLLLTSCNNVPYSLFTDLLKISTIAQAVTTEIQWILMSCHLSTLWHS